MLNPENTDARNYVERATHTALAGVSEGIARQQGRVLATDSWQDERGHWLRVKSTLDDLPGIEVHYARILLPASGPDKAPETEGMIFGSGFEERLHTQARDMAPVDGIVEL